MLDAVVDRQVNTTGFGNTDHEEIPLLPGDEGLQGLRREALVTVHAVLLSRGQDQRGTLAYECYICPRDIAYASCTPSN